MALTGWTRAESPFHEGELAVQARVGVQAQVDRQGRQYIREFLTDQHRLFFAQLRYVLLGAMDGQGYPWASILSGAPGFLATPDDRLLLVNAQLATGDPLALSLVEGAEVGLLGIDLATRRRNRVNGRVVTVGTAGFSVAVRQCFGNCPQYIQVRQVAAWRDDRPAATAGERIEAFGAAEVALISAADTFFITTAWVDSSAGMAQGVDVSHRGGMPGFVKVQGDRSLTIPDFSGNHHFNTLGNLTLNPRAGLLFIDFDRGDLLFLTGRAEVVWAGPEILEFAGAERLLRFHLDFGIKLSEGLPFALNQHH